MAFRFWLVLTIAVAALAGCPASSSQPRARVVVAVTIDWEGAYLSVDGINALADLREALPGVPLTHYVSAGYFTKPKPDATAATTIAAQVRPGDELAIHLHGWASLAKASGVVPKVSPSFLTGTEKLIDLEDGDTGFDTDLDVYTVPELRAMLRTSRKLVTTTGVAVTKDFRAGGYLGSPKMIEAIREEGYLVDSSATDGRPLAKETDQLPSRLAEIWPGITPASQPYLLPAGDSPAPVVEMPIAGIADYTEAGAMVSAVEAAQKALRAAPGRNVFVVLAFHQETAPEFAPRVVEAIQAIRARADLAADVQFATVEKAAELTHLAPAP
jgi:hypothetical protein